MKENKVKAIIAEIVENAVFDGLTREELDKKLRVYLGKPVSECEEVNRNDWEQITTIDETCDTTNFVVSVFKAQLGQFIVYSYEIED